MTTESCSCSWYCCTLPTEKLEKYLTGILVSFDAEISRSRLSLNGLTIPQFSSWIPECYWSSSSSQRLLVCTLTRVCLIGSHIDPQLPPQDTWALTVQILDQCNCVARARKSFESNCCCFLLSYLLCHPHLSSVQAWRLQLLDPRNVCLGW